MESSTCMFFNLDFFYEMSKLVSNTRSDCEEPFQNNLYSSQSRSLGHGLNSSEEIPGSQERLEESRQISSLNIAYPTRDMEFQMKALQLQKIVDEYSRLKDELRRMHLERVQETERTSIDKSLAHPVINIIPEGRNELTCKCGIPESQLSMKFSGTMKNSKQIIPTTSQRDIKITSGNRACTCLESKAPYVNLNPKTGKPYGSTLGDGV